MQAARRLIPATDPISDFNVYFTYCMMPLPTPIHPTTIAYLFLFSVILCFFRVNS